MDHIGIDVHKRDSQIYILAEGGEVVDQRIRTEGERFAAVLGGRARARMLIAYSDATIEHLAVQDPRVPRLRSVPSIGPVTAAAFLAAVDDAQRFRHAHQLEAYLGLVPREYNSGETQRRGPITKAGHSRVRWLLVQAAISILRRRPPAALPDSVAALHA